MRSDQRSFLISIFALLGSTAVFIMLKNKHEDSSADLEKSLPKKTIRSPNMREIAESKVDINALLNSANTNGDAPKTFLDPQNLKKESKNVGIEIAKTSIGDMSSSFLNSTDHLTCLMQYGFDRAWVDTIDAAVCKKNITTARAKIIAEITNNLPINKLTPEIAANRAIALIFSPQNAQNNAEIYQLSSSLLEKFPDLEEAGL